MNLKRMISMINTRDIEPIITGKNYYKNNNLILKTGVVPKGEMKDPLRSADNRIPHNFHELLVDEKASYLFTYAPIIDVDNNEEINEKVNSVLTDDFSRKLKNQCIEASNCGTSWIHYWIKTDIESNANEFKYALVPTEQIIPIYSNGLERELEGIIRHYVLTEYDEKEDKDIAYKYIEYWTNKKGLIYKFKNTEYGNVDNSTKPIEEIDHTLGEVPFIEFANNLKKQSDLFKYKQLIDLIDRVMSGFANDLDDIQEIIYILENYGGEDLNEFVSELKKNKAIQVETDSEGGGGGVKTLQIDIPVEARKVILEYLKKQIYEAGQGLPNDVEKVGVASGVSLKFLYRRLELKSGLLETEFRNSINLLVKAILKFLNISYTNINQTWTRNMISNDLENSQIAQQSMGVIPRKIILRNHPWIDDVREAEELLKEEEKENLLDYDFENIGNGKDKVVDDNERN